MQAILFNFSKRLNSTKRPNDAEGVPVTVSIKQNVPKGQSSSQSGTETFLSHPTIWVQGDYTEYNYMKFKGRYYFIRDIQLTINNATVIYGEIDVLASYKNEIRASSQFVLYDETINTEIPDKRLSVFTSEDVDYAPTEVLPFNSSSGSYVVSVNGEGTIDSFVINKGAINVLTDGFKQWLDDNQWNTEELLSQYCASGSIAENIKSAVWIPFDLSTAVSSADVTIKLGSWTTSVQGKRIVNRVISDEVIIPIPWKYNDWRNVSPYTHMYLYIPFIGMMEYPTSDIRNANSIGVKLSLDAVTGEITIEVDAIGSDYRLCMGTYGANTGAAFLIGESNVSGRQIVNGISQGVSNLLQGEGRVMMGAVSIATGNVPSGVAQIGSGFGAFGQSITGFTDAITPINSVVGSLGSASASGMDRNIQLRIVTHDVVGGRDGAIHFFGTPTMRYKSLSGLSGYVQCQNATVDVAAIGCVRDLINEALNRGIYIE